MKRISEYLFCWALGGTLYYAVELLFRGYSHWSMFLLGGFCFLFFAWQGLQGGWKTPLWKQVLRCTVFVTSGEFITGIFVNKWMQWNVWDYSDQPFQLFGQICLPFTILSSGSSFTAWGYLYQTSCCICLMILKISRTVAIRVSMVRSSLVITFSQSHWST